MKGLTIEHNTTIYSFISYRFRSFNIIGILILSLRFYCILFHQLSFMTVTIIDINLNFGFNGNRYTRIFATLSLFTPTADK